MGKAIKKIIACCAIFCLGAAFIAISAPASAEDLKIAHVDLRRTFYEYEKSKEFDSQLNEITVRRTEQREEIVSDIRKARDEAELLGSAAKQQKQQEIDSRISALNEFDVDTRQELLNKKNEMFREVVEDIQKIVKDIGEKEEYDYILDSRNIMYAKEEFDLTDVVLKKLNQ